MGLEQLRAMTRELQEKQPSQDTPSGESVDRSIDDIDETAGESGPSGLHLLRARLDQQRDNEIKWICTVRRVLGCSV